VARFLGAETAVTGFIGGFTGEYIRSGLERERIDTRFFATGKETRITLSYIEREKSLETKIVPAGPEISSGEMESFLQHFDQILKKNNFTVVGFCGSLPAGLPADYYGTLIDLARRHNVPAVLDTSGAPLAEGVKHSPLMIKPNLDEAAELCGSADEGDIHEFMKLFSKSVRYIALTHGKEGALVFALGRAFRALARNCESINPVGAGDSFIGGFMAAFDRFGADDERLFRWAAAAAACTACSHGLLWQGQEFDRMLERVGLQEINL
jgi:1-phosphofructokinase family hexose kinase